MSPTSIIAAGHDCTPLVFNVDGSGQVTFHCRYDICALINYQMIMKNKMKSNWFS